MKLLVFVFLVGILLEFRSNMALKLEQSCSKFHYEEQTLEKLIRLQIFVEKTKEEVEQTQRAAADELNKLKTEVHKMKNDMERTTAELKDDLSTAETQYLDAINRYSQIAAMNKESIMTPVVAFSSHTVTGRTMADEKEIVFRVDRTNYNSSYDNSTGIFTAPIDGIYVFTASICIQKVHWGSFGIFVNDKPVMQGILGNKVYNRCYSMTAVSEVAKGDRVSIRCQSCTGDKLFDHSSSFNSFSGTLINAL